MNSIIYTGKTNRFFINGNLYKIRYETEYGYIVYINNDHVIEIREDYKLNIDNTMESYYIFHGDVIDVFITKYKWLSKIGAVGYDFALWLNRVYNAYRKWRKLPYISISQKIKESV